MTTNRKPAAKLALVQPDLDQMEAFVVDAAAEVVPVASRYTATMDEMQLKVNNLIRERADFEDRRALVKARYEAVDNGLAAHIKDIDDVLALYPQPAAEA